MCLKEKLGINSNYKSIFSDQKAQWCNILIQHAVLFTQKQLDHIFVLFIMII